MTDEKPKRRRRGRKASGRHYFTQIHEDAIIEYNNCTDNKRREELYVTLIQPAMNELVDKIVYTYKFTTLPNIADLQDECKIWLTTVLEKFNPEKGSKAFSYFSVITKNWFIHKVKKHAVQRQREITFDEMPRAIEQKYLSTTNPYDEHLELVQFRQALQTEISKWGELPMKPSEKKVYDAVKILLDSPDDIEIFNKKAIYLYLRELTGLNTKQVVSNLNKLREKYKVFKNNWDEGEISHTEGSTVDCQIQIKKQEESS